MQYIETVIRYILSTAENMTAESLQQIVEKTLSAEQGALTMTIAEQLKEEGIQQGMQQGVRQGLLEGIELAIQIRFGAEGAWLLSEIHNVQDINLLRKVKSALSTARTADEVKAVIQTS